MRRTWQAIAGALGFAGGVALADTVWKNQGSTLGPALTVNCSGNGVTCNRVGSQVNIVIAPDGGNPVTNVTATPPIQSSGGATPNISCVPAGAGRDGCLTNSGGVHVTDAGLVVQGDIYIGHGKGGDIRNLSISDTAMPAVTTGYRNLGIGQSSLAALTSGQDLVAVGHGAMEHTTTSLTSVAVGNLSMWQNVSGDTTTAVGYWACREQTSGSLNVCIGADSNLNNQTGFRNVCVGTAACDDNTVSDQVCLGTYACYFNVTSAETTAVGNFSREYATAGNHDTCVGFQSCAGYSEDGGSPITPSDNLIAGWRAGWRNRTGTNNVFLGDMAGVGNDTTVERNACVSSSYMTLVGDHSSQSVAQTSSLTFGSCLGASCQVGTSGTVSLGRADGGDTVVIGQASKGATGTALQVATGTSYMVDTLYCGVVDAGTAISVPTAGQVAFKTGGGASLSYFSAIDMVVLDAGLQVVGSNKACIGANNPTEQLESAAAIKARGPNVGSGTVPGLILSYEANSIAGGNILSYGGSGNTANMWYYAIDHVFRTGTGSTTERWRMVNSTGGTLSSSVASGSNAVKLLDGSRLNFSTSDTKAYITRSTTDTLQLPGDFRLDQKFQPGNANGTAGYLLASSGAAGTADSWKQGTFLPDAGAGYVVSFGATDFDTDATESQFFSGGGYFLSAGTPQSITCAWHSAPDGTSGQDIKVSIVDQVGNVRCTCKLGSCDETDTTAAGASANLPRSCLCNSSINSATAGRELGIQLNSGTTCETKNPGQIHCTAVMTITP